MKVFSTFILLMNISLWVKAEGNITEELNRRPSEKIVIHGKSRQSIIIESGSPFEQILKNAYVHSTLLFSQQKISQGSSLGLDFAIGYEGRWQYSFIRKKIFYYAKYEAINLVSNDGDIVEIGLGQYFFLGSTMQFKLVPFTHFFVSIELGGLCQQVGIEKSYYGLLYGGSTGMVVPVNHKIWIGIETKSRKGSIDLEMMGIFVRLTL